MLNIFLSAIQYQLTGFLWNTAMIGGSRFLTLCTPTTPADMTMLATSVLLVSLLKNSELNQLMVNTDIVILVP